MRIQKRKKIEDISKTKTKYRCLRNFFVLSPRTRPLVAILQRRSSFCRLFSMFSIKKRLINDILKYCVIKTVISVKRKRNTLNYDHVFKWKLKCLLKREAKPKQYFYYMWNISEIWLGKFHLYSHELKENDLNSWCRCWNNY